MTNEKSGSRHTIPSWAYVAGSCVALALLCLYKFRPQLFGANGNTWLLIGIGLVFAIWTVSNIRSGTATLIYTSYKRSEDATGFWTAVAVEALISGVAIAFGIASLFGLWSS